MNGGTEHEADDDLVDGDDWLEASENADEDSDEYREYWMFARGPELRRYWEARTRTLGEIALGLTALANAIDARRTSARSQIADVLLSLADAISDGHWNVLAADRIQNATLLKALHTPATRHLRATGAVPTTRAEFGRRLAVELVLFALHEIGRRSGGSRRLLFAIEGAPAELAALVDRIRACGSHSELARIATDIAAERPVHESDVQTAALFFAWCDAHGVYREGAAKYFGEWLSRQGARFGLFNDVTAARIAARLAPLLASDLFVLLPADGDAVADLTQRLLRRAGLSPKEARNIVHAADDMREKRRAKGARRRS